MITGNGYNGIGYDGVHNFSESVLKLDPANGLALKDWFTPSNWSTLDNQDLDLTSSGPMLVPGTSLLVGGGKTGVLYVLNTTGTGLGKETANDSGAIQAIQISAGELRGGPVYWQRSTANGGPLLYDWGVSDRVKAFPFNGSTFATTPSAQGSVTNQIWPGGILTLSANGDTPGTGVLWATVAASGDRREQSPGAGHPVRVRCGQRRDGTLEFEYECRARLVRQFCEVRAAAGSQRPSLRRDLVQPGGRLRTSRTRTGPDRRLALERTNHRRYRQ